MGTANVSDSKLPRSSKIFSVDPVPGCPETRPLIIKKYEVKKLC
jgi:hypothetical protein